MDYYTPNFTSEIDTEATLKDICDSLLDFSKLLDSESDEKGDLLAAFGKISETLKENANKRRESFKAAAAGLSATEELLEEAEDQSNAAHELSEALGKAKDAVLDSTKKGHGAKPIRISREAGWAYHALYMAYSTARSASTAAASAMEATVSEVRAATAAMMAPAASKRAAEASAADVNAAARAAKAAAKEATALAVQAAAEALDMLKKLRDSTPRGTMEKIERGIKELEAIAAITEATTGAMEEMVSQTEDKAADAEEAARNAVAAAAEAEEEAEVAEAAGGLAEAARGPAGVPEGAIEGVEGTGPPKEVTAPASGICRMVDGRLTYGTPAFRKLCRNSLRNWTAWSTQMISSNNRLEEPWCSKNYPKKPRNHYRNWTRSSDANWQNFLKRIRINHPRSFLRDR